MNLKRLFGWSYELMRNYNAFMPEEDEYDEEPRDQATVREHQKYSTWLYVLLLLVSLYVLFYIALMKPQFQTITVSKVTPLIFNQLYADHGDTLSCPCTTNAILFKDFVSNSIIFHSICSSIFVSHQWIQALYNPNASTYTPSDFRTTAMSQFEILASFCSLSQDTVSENQIDIGFTTFYSPYTINTDKPDSHVTCSNANPITPAGFFEYSTVWKYDVHQG
ncbi:unnamed protein product, partial [Adineta steineri]